MDDPQIQQYAKQMQQRAEFQTLVNNITSDCWDKCITYTIGNLDGKQEKCLTNCVQRFIDASQILTRRLTDYGTEQAAKQKTDNFGSKLYNWISFIVESMPQWHTLGYHHTVVVEISMD